ncbi:5'-nucleotidase C-terminal domain-containing protein, partial [Cellulomonas sp.]|uniref:bifunctional metallophosphatase/5'-nucleotidase n=1 Tax=Cellulomonas sp. TaxID=40001 RepID=UPI001B1CE4EF
DGDAANGEADLVVALVHDGAGAGTPDGATLEQEVAAGGPFAALVTQTDPRVAAILTGHTHKQYAWNAPVYVGGVPTVDTRPIIQTGNYGEFIGHVGLDLDPVTLDVTATTAENVARTTTADGTLVAAYPRVAAVKTIVDAALAEAAVIGDQPVGSITADITTAFAGGSYTGGVWTGGARDDRASESALGNLVADSLVEALSAPERGGAEIGVVNPGGLRAELSYGADGVITYAEANSVLPFVNNLWTTTLTGAQLDALLEQQWQTTTEGGTTRPSRPYLALGLSSNVTWVADTANPNAAPGDHVDAIYIDGELVQPDDEIRVGTFSFLAAPAATAGDNFFAFQHGTNPTDSGLVDRDAWIDYLGEHSPLSPSFARTRSVVTGSTSVVAGSALGLSLAGLNLTSLGAPENTQVEVSLDGASLGTAPVSNGAADLSGLSVPSGASAGEHTLTLTISPSGTTVRIPVTVAPIQPLTVGVPVVSGSLRVGQSLVADAGVWGPVPVVLSYRWYTVASDLVTRTLVQEGASASYTPSASDVGKYVYVVVTGSKAGYTSVSAQSAWRGYVAAATLTAGTPVVSGVLKVGSVLTADAGVWGPVPV